MGAPARSWVGRGAVVLAVVAGVWLVLAWPMPTWLRALVLLLAMCAGTVVAFRQIPAFDPLGRVRWRVPGRGGGRAGRVCAITFDDGPSADTPRVLEVLQRHRVKATFFVLADNARRHPDVLRSVAAAGHTVAVHGTSHAKLHRASQAQIEAELDTAVRELREIGVSPAPLYRSPHGLKNAAVFRAIRKLGFELWAWSRGIWDTDRPAPEVLVRRATRFARSGMVLLLHDGRGTEASPDIAAMVSALPTILDRLRARGFSFVTLDQA